MLCGMSDALLQRWVHEEGCCIAHLEADLPLLKVVVLVILVLRWEIRLGDGS